MPDDRGDADDLPFDVGMLCELLAHILLRCLRDQEGRSTVFAKIAEFRTDAVNLQEIAENSY